MGAVAGTAKRSRVKDAVASPGKMSDRAGEGRRIASEPACMAATASRYATEAAVEILEAGGNAVDAATAAAWALCVCEPSGSGLGGQTSLLVRLADGTTTVIDGSSHAPAAVSRKSVSRDQQRRGHRACTVPSTPATLGYAQGRYGKLSLARVMEPAIRLAEEGYRVTKLHRRQVKWCFSSLSATAPTTKLFLRKERPPRTGRRIRQKKLGRTLTRLSELGVEDFYRGEIAQKIADDMRRNGGLITLDDLADLRLPVERNPLSVSYRGLTVLSVPPPGGGIQVLLGLKALEHLMPEGYDGEEARWYRTMAEIIYEVFSERERWPLRPRDLTPSFEGWLLGDEHASEIARTIESRQAGGSPMNGSEGPGDTTHLCTADGQGNVVSLTQSIQSLFGAKVANYELGFLYNNSLCTCPRHPHPNQLGSRCAPRSNAAPTLVIGGDTELPDRGAVAPVLGDGAFLALGAAGSRRITSSILQVVTNVVDRSLALGDAVSEHRVHALLSRKVELERGESFREIRGALEGSFRAVRPRAAHSYAMGAVQAVAFDGAETFTGAADPRRDGTARGASS